MKYIPVTQHAVLLRTDFSDDAAWQALCTVIQAPAGDFGFRAYVECISDPEFAGLTADQVPARIAPDSHHTALFIVDQRALSDPEHPVLVVDLYAEPGRTFRVIPSEMWAVENNLSLANMDFCEFADNVDADGVFRGF